MGLVHGPETRVSLLYPTLSGIVIATKGLRHDHTSLKKSQLSLFMDKEDEGSNGWWPMG